MIIKLVHGRRNLIFIMSFPYPLDGFIKLKQNQAQNVVCKTICALRKRALRKKKRVNDLFKMEVAWLPPTSVF